MFIEHTTLEKLTTIITSIKITQTNWAYPIKNSASLIHWERNWDDIDSVLLGK